VPVVATATVELAVNVIDCVPMSPTAPLMSVVLLTSNETVYRGLVAETTVPFVCRNTAVTVVPHAACSVANTFVAAVSFRKSIVTVDDSKPFTN
jgi:hypothetical protein